MRRLFSFTLLALLPLSACEAGEPGEEAIEQAEDDLGVETPDVQPVVAEDRVTLGTDTLNGSMVYLTDGAGRAVYLFTADTAGTSTCYDACAEAWPPLMAAQAEAAAGSARPDLIGVSERPGAGLQVTYGGHPLYYYAQDGGPGEATGQDNHSFGGEWYLITPDGAPLAAEDSGEE